MGQSTDSLLSPNVHSSNGMSRRRLLATSATAGVVATAGFVSNERGGDAAQQSTVFVFNTGDGTMSHLDPERDEVVETRAVDLSSSFPSKQYTAELTDDSEDSLWLNVGRGVRGLSVGSLSETASVETDSGANA